MRRNAVVGQTGRVVLSEDALHRRVSINRKVRYQYTKTGRIWRAWVCGPFHSRTYGACSFGTTKVSAKAALQLRLANSYRYFGNMIFSDVDEANDAEIIRRKTKQAAHNLVR